MGEILKVAEALWQEETDTYAHHPFGVPRGLETIAPDTWFYRGFANMIVRETDDGLILVDPGSSWDARQKFEAIRSVSGKPLNAAIYTHGHVDHVFGAGIYAEEAAAKGWPPPQVIAHEGVAKRFDRYRETVGWNGYINLRQFRGGVGEPLFPREFYYPDTTYGDRKTLTIGGIDVMLRHTRGETDDHTWVFFPDNRVLCTGDLFIWSVPNAGNPQKVQRYAKEWADGLREMAALEPEILAPGHGLPIIGSDRVRQALEDTAAFLESIHEQTLAMMNEGLSLDEVIHTVKPPEDLRDKPYLQPVYDEPEFIARNIWRHYGGWYDGTPSHLKPASERDQATEIARLAGGAEVLAARAEECLSAGDLRLACHLVDWAHMASPEDPGIGEIGARVYMARAEVESSTMAIGIYSSAARELGGDAAGLGTGDIISSSVMRAQTRQGKPASDT